MQIRELQAHEVESAASLVGLNYDVDDEKQATKEMAAMFLEENPLKPIYFVAEEQKEIIWVIGVSLSRIDYDVYELFWLNVHPNRQGQGIGTKLTNHVIDYVKSRWGKMIIISAGPHLVDYYEGFWLAKVNQISEKQYLMTFKI